MNKLQALNNFFNSFSLTAYDESSVPDNASLPYITYESMLSDFNNYTQLTASLWYYGSSMAQLAQKTLEIDTALSKGGKLIAYQGGAFWIRKATPFAQSMSDTNDMIRRMVLNFIIEYIGE